MQAEEAQSAVRRVLLAGSSLFTFSETDESEAPPALLQQELARRAPYYAWECAGRLLYQTPTSVQRVRQWLDEYDPDGVVFEITSYQFVHRAVTVRIKKLWPLLYGPAFAAVERLKRAGGGSFDGAQSPRGLLFRVPRLAAYRLIGGVAELSVEESMASVKATLDEIRRREKITLVCSMPKLQWREMDHDWSLGQVRVAADEMRRYCRRHHIPLYDVEAELARSGRMPGVAPDGIHYDRATARVEASLMAGALIEAFGQER